MRGGAVATGADDPDEDGPDDADDLAELPPPVRFRGLPSATGLMGREDDDCPHRIATGPMDDGSEPEAVAPPALTRVGEGSRDEHYRTFLRDARTHLEALRSWSAWLKQREEVFLVEMWDKHGVDGVAAQIDRTVESLRWVAGNLVW